MAKEARPGENPRAATPEGPWRTLEDLADPKYLRRVWTNEISRQLRDLKFSSRNLIIDPLQGIVTARNLDDFIGQLSRDLKSGRYTPEAGVILRSAKKLGISRPVCFMQPRDALVYRALVRLAERELLNGIPSWVAFQRADKADGSGAEDDSESIDWFERWMRHEGMLPNLIHRDDIKYVVQSDVSNFFPSVRLEVVREHLSNNTTLDRTLVRLCCQIIAAAHPRVAYADDSFLGLPQEAHGASRVIAQAILKPVDDEFMELGTDGRYSRFMDDVLWGANSVEEAHRILARFQQRLEEVGLYPNGSKTRVVEKSEFLEAYMVSSNAKLERIDKLIEPLFDQGRSVTTPPDRILFEVREASRAHRDITKQPDRWPRVTRRIYTLHRRLGIDDWWGNWPADLASDPGGAAGYFEYFRSWPLTKERLDTAGQTVDEFFGLYPDVEIIFGEAIATAPNPYSEELWGSVFKFGFSRFKRFARGREANQHLASTWFIVCAKFANDRQRVELVTDALKWCADSMPDVIAQCVALDAGRQFSKVLAPVHYGATEALATDFFLRLDESDAQTTNVIRKHLEPVSVLAPRRAVVRPRALLLLGRLGRLGVLKESDVNRWLSVLEGNTTRLRDHRVEYLLKRWA
ncbi:RNA-directed DNA polymerase [Microbacterium sp. Marseille-Q6965]|uniref:RNA-directed DNA polymerase n=1 Tax=Microbacterium sp. Marseille-Q6965 TaxID=2965072 RepID=UPI0021B7541D|nr:RNA-directed DNA polymerase [Microbacterium sp. Marseille-Q6965]